MSLANKAQSTSQLTTLDNVSIRTKSPTQQQQVSPHYEEFVLECFVSLFMPCICMYVCMYVGPTLSLSSFGLPLLKVTRFRVCISCALVDRLFWVLKDKRSLAFPSWLLEMRANCYLFVLFFKHLMKVSLLFVWHSRMSTLH
jgi:hypothetical protein